MLHFVKSSRQTIILFLICGLSFPLPAHSVPDNPPGSLIEAASDLITKDPFVRNQKIEFLTYEELCALSKNPHAHGPLKKKLERFWTTPIINNEPYYRGVKPRHPHDARLGNILRVASWNIEKSFHIERVANLFVSDKAFDLMINKGDAPAASNAYLEIKRQRNRLILADILVLQEIDIGVKRSDYIDAAQVLAAALDMNYVYAPAYLEVDPVLLGLEKLKYDDGSVDEEASAYYAVDPAKVKNVFGSAILSRYPVKYAEIKPLRYQAYDWYAGEKEKVGFLEHSRRFGSKTIFKNEITRELKVGGRNYFRADLHVPGLPNDTLTIINIHLEIKCLPEARTKQIEEILSYIRPIKNPVVMLGDFNAAPTDISATSVGRVVKRTLKNPTTWLSVGINAVSPHALAINTTRGVSNVTKNFNDPLAKDIKIVAPNPLKPMFNAIENFRFLDGGAFDFRGDENRSAGGKDQPLANSNQRGTKGFKTSFSVKRALGVVGKYRLDWVFVKSLLKDSRDVSAPYKWAPHFGETLEELNTGLLEPISDHHPNVVDFPVKEPKMSA